MTHIFQFTHIHLGISVALDSVNQFNKSYPKDDVSYVSIKNDIMIKLSICDWKE